MSAQTRTISCPYCQGTASQQPGSLVHGANATKWLFVCENYPTCDTYVSCHDNGEPMGTLAGKRLRKLRQMAHRNFDPLWEANSADLGRKAAYEAAAKVMEISGEFHIGNLDERGCEEFLRRLDIVEQEFDRLLEVHHGKGAPPNEMTLEVLHALFHPDRDTYHKSVDLQVLTAYDSVWRESVRCGLVVQEQFKVALTQKGVGLVYDPIN